MINSCCEIKPFNSEKLIETINETYKMREREREKKREAFRMTVTYNSFKFEVRKC